MYKTMSTKFMTPTEVKRDERNSKICSEFKRLRSENPEVSKSRLIGYISSKFGLCTATVTRVLDKQS